MAEHWKSTPRYWCKQCKIYIRDTSFERTQHEATGKHQGNLKRFLRDIHRDNERQQRESARAKSEVERLRQTVSAGGGGSSTSTPSSQFNNNKAAAAPPPERPVPVEERKRQMAQLAEMGVAIPEEYRGDMALAGDWQTVSTRVVKSEGDSGGGSGGRKRKHEGAAAEVDEEEEEAKKEAEKFVSRAWGSRVKTYPGAGDDDGDLDALLESTKGIKKGKGEGASTEGNGDGEPADSKKGGQGFAEVKEEEGTTEDMKPKPEGEGEGEGAGGGVVFKKRKPKVMRK